jgi:hypothetical protein
MPAIDFRRHFTPPATPLSPLMPPPLRCQPLTPLMPPLIFTPPISFHFDAIDYLFFAAAASAMLLDVATRARCRYAMPYFRYVIFDIWRCRAAAASFAPRAAPYAIAAF